MERRIACDTKETKFGVKYNVSGRINAGNEILYIFDSNNDADYEIVKDAEALKDSECLFLEQRLLKYMVKKYKDSQSFANPMIPIQGSGETYPKNMKAIVIPLEREFIETEGFLEYVIQIFRTSKVKLVFVANETLEQIGVAYKRFRLIYPDMSVKRISFDASKYLSDLWITTFQVSPDFDTGKLIRKIRSCTAINSRTIKSVVTYFANHTDSEDGIPSKEEISEFFDLQRSRDWRKDLDNLVGMEECKQEILELINQQIYLAALKKKGMCDSYMPVRSVISGNPGVGKSTLLEIIARAFQEEGLTPKGVRMISCRSLISDHIGGSEERLRKLSEECDLLILDELGGLTIGDAFDSGIVQQLVYMSEMRKDLHMFFIGYDRDVKDFLKLNPGLRSRIQNYIHIPDYDKQQLVNIGTAMLQKYHYDFNEESLQKVLWSFVEHIVNVTDYGNARAMRVLVDQLNTIKGSLYAKSGKLEMEVSAEQMKQAVHRCLANQPKEERRKSIGFSM